MTDVETTILNNCRTCCHAYWGTDGCIKCDLNPFDAPRKQSVIDWINAVGVGSAFTTHIPCPRWEKWSRP